MKEIRFNNRIIEYVAFDDSRIASEEECKEYEDYLNKLAAAWESIPKLVYDAESLPLYGHKSDKHYLLCCRTEEEVEAANEYLVAFNHTDLNAPIPLDRVGKRVLVTIWEENSKTHIGTGWYLHSSPEEIVASLTEMLSAPIPGAEGINPYTSEADVSRISDVIAQHLRSFAARSGHRVVTDSPGQIVTYDGYGNKGYTISIEKHLKN